MNHALFLLFTCGAVLTAEAQQGREPSPAQAQAKFSKADRELNEAWTAVKKTLPEAEFATLRDEQRSWVEYRDQQALSEAYSGAPGDPAKARLSAEYLNSAAELATARTSWLRGFLVDEADESLTGVWTDSYGGRIEIVEQNGRLNFVIEVVRGPTAHVGGLAGSASWNRPIGWFSDKGRDKTKEDESNLAFVRRSRKLEVIGANTGHYHGARAYFDGSYVRVEKLPAKAQARVLKAAQDGEVPEGKEPRRDGKDCHHPIRWPDPGASAYTLRENERSTPAMASPPVGAGFVPGDAALAPCAGGSSHGPRNLRYRADANREAAGRAPFLAVLFDAHDPPV